MHRFAFGAATVGLLACTALGWAGTASAAPLRMGKPLTPAEVGTVYVDVNCPDDDED